MIVTRKCSGYQQNKINIEYVNCWSERFKNAKQMFFYNKDSKNVVDICYGTSKKDINICYYDHNGDDFLNRIKDLDETFLRDILEMWKINPGDIGITVDLSEKRRVLYGDFISFSFRGSPDYSMFIFEFSEPLSNKLQIFVKSKPYVTSEDAIIFPVQVYTSHHIASATKPTDTGKKFTFMLIHSTLSGKFSSKIPAIGAVHFPTNSYRDEISRGFKTDALLKFAAKITKNLKIKNGNIEEINPKIDDDKPNFVLTGEEEHTLYDRIIRDMVDKGTVTFSDMLGYGVKETIALVKDSSKIIPISLDLQNILKRGCIFEGFVYGILDNVNVDWNLFTGEPDDLFVECDEESFPSNNYKN